MLLGLWEPLPFTGETGTMQGCLRLKGQNVPKGQAHHLYIEQNIWDSLTFSSGTNCRARYDTKMLKKKKAFSEPC